MKHKVWLLAIVGIALSASLSAVSMLSDTAARGSAFDGAVDRNCFDGDLRFV